MASIPDSAVAGQTTQREIGRTGLKVYPIGLGGMWLSIQGRPDERAAIGVIHAALEAGVTLIDTADSYCLDEADKGHNERLIAKALKAHPLGKSALVATKGGMTRPGGDWHIDGRPEKLAQACERSLKALGVEAITLYQLHWPDKRVPYADSIGALQRLQEQGKIRHVGISNVDARQLAAAQKIVRVESVQNRCNPFDHGDLRNGVLQACAEQGVSYIAYSPFGASGHGRLAKHALLQHFGQAHGASPYCIALAWLLALGSHVLPIPGASRAASIQDSATAAQLQLRPEEVRQISAL